MRYSIDALIFSHIISAVTAEPEASRAFAGAGWCHAPKLKTAKTHGIVYQNALHKLTEAPRLGS